MIVRSDQILILELVFLFSYLVLSSYLLKTNLTRDRKNDGSAF